MTTKQAFLILLTFICLWTISCKPKDTSEIEIIIVNEEFIKNKITGYDSISVDSSKESKVIKTTYFLKNNLNVSVIRDSLNKIRAWFLKNNKGQNIDGAEVSPITGQILGKLHFVNGVLDGEVKYYYDNGRVKSKGVFKNGSFWGEWKNYDKNGNLVSIDSIDDNHNRTTKKVNE